MTSLWRNLQYVSWLVSDTSKGLAGALFRFAVPLIALFVTNDPAQAGIIAGVGMAVSVSLTLFGGVLADRHRRLTLMVLGASIGVALSIAFTLFALGDALTFSTLLALEVLLAARSGIFDPSGEAALKDLVAADTMGRAQAANQARDAALQLAGGPIGGALLVVGGWLIGAVMAACQLISAIAAALIPLLRGAEKADAAKDADGLLSLSTGHDDASTGSATHAVAKPNALREIREGFAWLFSRRDLRGVLLISTVINLGINTVMTTIVYSLQQDGESPAVIGWISAGMGVMMLAGALMASPLVGRIGAGRLMIVGLIALSIGAAATIFTRDPLGIVLVMAVPGLLLAPLNAGLGGYFMVATPSELMGRASSASAVFAMGAMPLAPLIAGFGLSLVGRTGTIMIGVVLSLVATAMAITNRPLRSLPAEAGWEAHAAQFADAGSGVPVR
ncbi:MFS transporter [Microbacterium sp. KUDC0406]|uniref:MFS transporter n=1 Tax=Microbacterium sp. KUDC0406 TaxID=2909588 RepID=UPI001F3D70DF|nr:MFS transporter [Microbacterium sp. KUDC0406]UJP09434.1 MFS transporter [Microbacterium sp. KUDC0406]